MRVGDVIDGKYELVRLLGQGGMASVFVTRHLRLGRQFAIKLLRHKYRADPVMVERLLREARAAAAIGSPHIVEVTDAGETAEGIPYLVMEYLEGRDLAALLRDEGWLSPPRAISFVLQACQALAAAHRQGIVHRDLKPENLFVVPQGDGQELVKLLDFGIALLRETLEPEEPRLTTAGLLVGTPCYMSPEQARGLPDLDHRVDVYGLGAVMYEALAGTPLFQGQGVNELIQAITTSDPIPLLALRPQLDPALALAVHRAMARNPGKRYASIADLAHDLEELQRQTSPPPPALEGPELGSAAGSSPSPATAVTRGVGPGSTPAIFRPWRGFWLVGLAFLTLLGGALALSFLRSPGVDDGAIPDVHAAEPGMAPAAPPARQPGTEPDQGGPPVAPPASSAAAPPPPKPAERATIQVSVRLQPPSARLRIDGREAQPESSGLFVVQLPRDKVHHRLDASAPGHRKQSLLVALERDQELNITLVPRPKGPPPSARPEPAGRESLIDSANPYRRER